MHRYKCKYNCLLYWFYVYFKDPVGQTNYQIVLALTYILILTGKTSDINTSLIGALEKSQISHWADCLDKRQVR